ncbi:MAG: endo alpha-1,4 polygalactosaminidase [Actinomycetota bacterium]
MRYARALLTMGLLFAAFAMPSAVAAEPPPVTPQRVTLPPRVRCPGCWHPGLRTSWQWQLSTVPRARDLLDVRMYDIDGFDARRRLVSAMHDRGIKAVCYVSAGSWENWRPDAADFPAIVKGRSNGWPGERWLDVRRLDLLRPIIAARVAMCDRKGFDAVEFDNVDGYQNGTGFPLTGADQLRYNVFLANEAHRHGMSALLKNDLGQIRRLVRYFDGALNEQCHQYDECGRLSRFVEHGKPVFGVEYGLETTEFCPSANARNFNFLKKRLSLAPWRVPCRGP